MVMTRLRQQRRLEHQINNSISTRHHKYSCHQIIKWSCNTDDECYTISGYCLNCWHRFTLRNGQCLCSCRFAHIKNTVPVNRVKEVFLSIGVELAAGILSAGPLTCVCIIHQLEANVGTSEIYIFMSQFYPTCQQRGTRLDFCCWLSYRNILLPIKAKDRQIFRCPE